MAHKSAKKFSLLQPGFHFAPGHIFPDQDRARIYPVLLGNDADSLTKGEAKERGAEILAILFRAVIDQAAIYKALHGNDTVWEIIVNRATLFDDITIADARMVIEKLAAAREAYFRKDYPRTDLTGLVDQYLALRDATVALGPARTFEVVRRANPASTPTSMAVAGAAAPMDELAVTLGSLSITGPWPPLQFVLGDLSVLSLRWVKATLAAGVTTELPGSLSLPSDLVTAVAKIAVHNYQDTSPWALFLSPVAYLGTLQRREWYFSTGHQARLFATWAAFLNYTKQAFLRRNKTTVVGMVVYWQGTPRNFEHLTNVYKADARHVWQTSNFLKRHATLIILRRCAGDTIQSIWFDPWYSNVAIKEHYKARAMALFDFRAGVVDKLLGWAAENNTRIHSRYWGGANITGVTEDDSVKMSLSYLKMITSGRLTLPDPEDGEGFKALGYMKTE